GDGNDTLSGNAGADNLDGGPGNDSLNGGDDNDNLDGGPGTAPDADDIVGGEGDNDFVDYFSRTNPVTVNLTAPVPAGAAEPTTDGETGEGDAVHSDVEEVDTGSGNDTVNGNERANVIFTGAGNDTVTGGPDALNL